MKLDITLKEVLIKLQGMIRQKYGIEMSIQEIGVIYESQFQVSALAFKKGVNVRLPYFGVFIRKRKLDKISEYKELKKEEPFISKEEYKRKLLELKMQQKAITSSIKSDTVAYTFEELKEVKDIVDVANKFDKVFYEG
jgi:hypothetical protein